MAQPSSSQLAECRMPMETFDPTRPCLNPAVSSRCQSVASLRQSSLEPYRTCKQVLLQPGKGRTRRAKPNERVTNDDPSSRLLDPTRLRFQQSTPGLRVILPLYGHIPVRFRPLPQLMPGSLLLEQAYAVTHCNPMRIRVLHSEGRSPRDL